jgi:Alr-MurF fusion protein
MISLNDLLRVAHGQFFGEPDRYLFSRVSLDPQDVDPDTLFMALRDAQGDTHRFIDQAIANGAGGVICIDPPLHIHPGVSVLMVDDPIDGLLRWGYQTLARNGIRTIVVVGSTGTSVTAHLIHDVVVGHLRVHMDGSEIRGRSALALSMVSLEPEHELAIFCLHPELPGDMVRMIEVTRPEMAVVTHLDDRSTPDGLRCQPLLDEIGVLTGFLSPGGVLTMPQARPAIMALVRKTRAQLITTGVDVFEADVMAHSVDWGVHGTEFELRVRGERIGRCRLALPGEPALGAALAAIPIAQHLGVSNQDAMDRLARVRPLAGRMRVMEGPGGCTLIDDTFHADVPSALQALHWLQQLRGTDGRIILILGDIQETAAYKQAGLRLIGRRAAAVVDHIVTLGTESAVAGRAATDHDFDPRALWALHSAQDVAGLIGRLQPTQDDILLVKGAGGTQIGSVVRALVAQTVHTGMLVRRSLADIPGSSASLVHASRVEINTLALGRNVRTIRSIIGPQCELMAVVKSDGYGHGATTVAITALQNGATWLAVSTIDEGLDLRDAGITEPILVLSHAPIAAIEQAVRADLAVVAYDLDLLRGYEHVVSAMGAELRVHVKIDSGMGRLGILPDAAVGFFRHLVALPHIRAEGVFTHFSAADADAAHTASQVDVFRRTVRPLMAAGYSFRYIHAENSAAMLSLDSELFNVVRVGILMYGLQTSPELALPAGFEPVLTWKTSVIQVKELPAGHAVGYGNTYRTQAPERVAILPVGYAQGLRRAPQPWREVLIHGQRAPVIGRISMEKTTVSLAGIPDVAVGDEVVLVGAQGADRITIDEAAGWLGTIGYELVTTLDPRRPRQVVQPSSA